MIHRCEFELNPNLLVPNAFPDFRSQNLIGPRAIRVAFSVPLKKRGVSKVYSRITGSYHSASRMDWAHVYPARATRTWDWDTPHWPNLGLELRRTDPLARHFATREHWKAQPICIVRVIEAKFWVLKAFRSHEMLTVDHSSFLLLRT
jgi:hypothetical protein